MAGSALATGLAQLCSLIVFLIYFVGGQVRPSVPQVPLPAENPAAPPCPWGWRTAPLSSCLGFLTVLYNNLLFLLFGESHQTIYAVIAYLSLLVFMVMQGIAQG